MKPRIQNFIPKTYKALRSSIKSNPWYYFLAPILITWYVFVSLYSHNISGITIDYFWKPFLIATLLTVLFFGLMIALFKNLGRASLIASFFLITFFAFGHIATLMGGENYDASISYIIFAGYALLLAVVVWYIKKGSPGLANVLKFLSIIIIFSTIIALVSVVPVEVERYQSHVKSVATASELPVQKESKDVSNKPDIYYLIFDRYAGVHTLQNYYGFDNQPFLNSLRDQGFYVAEDSYANYPKTTFSLSSSLNLDYLQNLIDSDDPTLSDATTIATLLSNNKAGQTLKKLGYTYYHIGNWYELTDTMDVANVNIQPSKSDFPRYDTFTDMILESTYYPLVSDYLPFSDTAGSKVRHRLWSEFQHQQINEVVTKEEPKFVVMHMLLPHDPFVYNAECKPLDPPLDRWDASPEDYTNQLQCANQVIADITNNILQNSDTPPIIIVQSDEGPEAKVNYMPHHWQFGDASADDIKERAGILNAYYFPDQNYTELYQGITPVNSFRTIFRQYFDLDTPNLEDKNYVFPDKDHLFDFIDITKQLRN